MHELQVLYLLKLKIHHDLVPHPTELLDLEPLSLSLDPQSSVKDVNAGSGSRNPVYGGAAAMMPALPGRLRGSSKKMWELRKKTPTMSFMRGPHTHLVVVLCTGTVSRLYHVSNKDD